VSYTLEQATTLAQKGYRMRHPSMSEGWVVGWWWDSKSTGGLFNVNPHTGSTYGFIPRPEHKTGWEKGDKRFRGDING
jgi:hypothetical protein